MDTLIVEGDPELARSQHPDWEVVVWHHKIIESLAGKVCRVIPSSPERGAKIVAKLTGVASEIFVLHENDWRKSLVAPAPPPPPPPPTDMHQVVAAKLAAGSSAEPVLDIIAESDASEVLTAELLAMVVKKTGIDRKAAKQHILNKRKKIRAPAPRETYGLVLREGGYEISAMGVWRQKYVDGGWQRDPRGQIAARPIWPAQVAIDESGTTWLLLKWQSPMQDDGIYSERWVEQAFILDRDKIKTLPGAPVSLENVNAVSHWLTEAMGQLAAGVTAVKSTIGWANGKWCWPEVGVPGYVGDDIGTVGDLKKWLAGAEAMMADSCWPAWAALGLSIAAPISRLMNKRCPVLGLANSSSTGKGSSLDYALSVWMAPGKLTASADSTTKGIQDAGLNFTDLPFFVDDLHQLADVDIPGLQGILYYLGNGQRRTTSSRGGAAKGGQRRYGVGLYAAERSLLTGIQLGAQIRCWEITGDPVPTQAVAEALRRATRHGGAMAALLATAFENPAEIIEQINNWADRYREKLPGLTGDDADGLAMVWWGLSTLTRLTGLKTPAIGVLGHLSAHIEHQRLTVVDRETQAWRDLLDMVNSQEWHDFNMPGVPSWVAPGGARLAWRTLNQANEVLSLDVNQMHPQVVALMGRHGGWNALKGGWFRRGWIQKQGEAMLVQRTGCGRVIRATDLGLGIKPGKVAP